VASKAKPKALTVRYEKLLAEWSVAWGLPGLGAGIAVEFSSRLKRSLGRSRPQLGKILLHESLRVQRRALLPMVLCHEAAHLAAFHLWGRKIRPHGPEWAELVRASGHDVSTTVRVRARAPKHVKTIVSTDEDRGSQQQPRRRQVLHYCPVCQTQRLAKRAVPQWRCAECRAAGLDGRMEVISLKQKQL
jgi:predicted SprT family Zn-dependent metalloprotease